MLRILSVVALIIALNFGAGAMSEAQAKPACVSWSANRIDCFARGTDNAMWHRWWDGAAWAGWESLGGILTSDPQCTSWSANRIDCFGRGLDNALWHRSWNGASWSGWASYIAIFAVGNLKVATS